jgi:uncharacterized membrane protein YjjP (DUF1212 family)
MRVVEVSDPRLERLAGADALLDRVERGEIGVADAYVQLKVLERAPGIRRLYARIAILVSVTGWMLFLNGAGFATIAVALLATVLTFPTMHSSIVSNSRLSHPRSNRRSSWSLFRISLTPPEST